MKIQLRNEEQDSKKHFERRAESQQELDLKKAEIDSLNRSVKEVSEELSEKKMLIRKLETVVQ